MSEVAMLTPTPFYYLRHGETDWNRETRKQGNTDIPLNDTGVAQAEAARDALSRCDIATICASPLQRALKTAEIVNEVLKRSLVVIDDLRECNFGAGEGQLEGQWYYDWFDGITPPGGEPYADFLARALGGVNEALTHPGPVLIVAHGGVYRAVRHYARLAREGALANCQPLHHEPSGASGAAWTASTIGG